MLISNQPEARQLRMADNSNTLAVIGGSGLYSLRETPAPIRQQVATPFADAPVQVDVENLAEGRVLFLPRHGAEHAIAPHHINYRANLWALHQAGARAVIAINAVGGIGPGMEPGTLVLPDQLIDYSYGREHSFFSGQQGLDKHVDFTWPYDNGLAAQLAAAGSAEGVLLREGGVYACTQGPRLETAAEIRRLARDGCDLVGMTGMPEAVLARELGLPYCCLALVVNRAAGLSGTTISLDEITSTLNAGIATLRRILLRALPELLAAGRAH